MDAEPVHFAGDGINMRELITEGKCVEFTLDLDFSKKNGLLFDDSLALDIDDCDDSDDNNSLKSVEQSAEKLLLASPEYHSFEQLASKMIDCDDKGEVKMLIIEEGDGPLVAPDSEVLFHYAAYYERCKIPFDSTLTTDRGQPVRRRMNIGTMIKGVEVGLKCIKGPTARFYLLLEPIMAYGLRGVPPRILPQTVLFVISLYDVRCVDAAARFCELPLAEKENLEKTIQTVKEIRAEAKHFFEHRKYVKAIEMYHKAVSVLSQRPPQNKKERSEINSVFAKIYENLAVCYYKLKKPKYILLMCKSMQQYTDIDNHCKCNFYYGRAYELIGKTDLALSYYKKALKLEPKNQEIGQVLANFERNIKETAIDEIVMWERAVNETPDVEEKLFYNVDDDFKKGIADMCQDLAGRSDFAKFDLSMGLNKDEINCIKDVAKKFKCLEVVEEGDGKQKKASVIKKA